MAGHEDRGSAQAAPSNAAIAARLRRVASLLEVQEANPFRVKAYRRAADATEAHGASLASLVAGGGGADALRAALGVGASLASLIEEFVETGRMRVLERLEGQIEPAALFATIPGIGPELAERIVTTLGVDTLEALELAAHDGRLSRVEGFGEGRVRAVATELESRLRRETRRALRQPPPPTVPLLLAVDAVYRARAQAGKLPRIAPRRFNPTGEAWLPVLHTEREGYTLTALYSNTGLAHELGTTRDWVVIYYERDGLEGQCTVVTERRGALAGARVVRGRECESAQAVAHRGPSSTPGDGREEVGR